jgi:hypothetical protein
MRVLVACEESQAVCIAFRNKGHEAYSCDIEPCSGGHPEWHIQGDVLEILNDGWDMMIAFPPCTHLAVSGAAWFEQKRKDGRQQEGIDFFMRMINASATRICVENPVGIMSKIYRKPDQIIHPYDFGDPFSKSTCLWLKGLPLLQPTCNDYPLFGETIVKDDGYFTWVDKKTGKTKRQANWYYKTAFITRKNGLRSKARSKTFPGIAEAMSLQWNFKEET